MASSTPGVMTLQTQAHELVKTFAVYDVHDRLTTIYTAPAAAGAGTPCSKVDYTYTTATGSLVEKMRESVGSWLVAYDI